MSSFLDPAAPAAAGSPVRPRRRSWWLAVLLAVAIVVVGAVVAVRGWLATGGPDGAVRGYFAALADGDAATALGYGDIPAGPRTLLTDRVLAAQLTAAPIEDVTVTSTRTNGDQATVTVDYTLAFAGEPRTVRATIRLHRDDDWRLDQSAVPTQLVVARATQRASVLGARIPIGTTLVFPAAAPITFDTDYLRLTPSRGYVVPDAGSTVEVEVEASAAGTAAALSAVRRALTGCLDAGVEPRCPLPSERYVPGSVRGALSGNLADQLDVDVTTSAAGEFEVTGDAKVTGDYQRLEFDNRRTSKNDTAFTVPVAARLYAVAPLTVRWERPT